MGKLTQMFEDFDKPEKASKPKAKASKPKRQTSTSSKKEQLAQEIIYKAETVIEMLLDTWLRFKDKGSSHGNEMRKIIERIEEYKKL